MCGAGGRWRDWRPRRAQPQWRKATRAAHCASAGAKPPWRLPRRRDIETCRIGGTASEAYVVSSERRTALACTARDSSRNEVRPYASSRKEFAKTTSLHDAATACVRPRRINAHQRRLATSARERLAGIGRRGNQRPWAARRKHQRVWPLASAQCAPCAPPIGAACLRRALRRCRHCSLRLKAAVLASTPPVITPRASHMPAFARLQIVATIRAVWGWQARLPLGGRAMALRPRLALLRAGAGLPANAAAVLCWRRTRASCLA